MVGIEDNQDQIVRLLQQIRDASQGASLPGQDGGSSSTVTRKSSTTLRVHDVAGQYSPPQNSINLVNQRWEDDSLSDADITDLKPGESQTVAFMQSHNSDIYVAATAVSTTEHAHDMDGDGKDESVIEYSFEYQTHGGGDSWNTLPGMNTTLPFGDYLGHPVEIIPGKSVGPMSGFRVKFRNVSDGTADPTTVQADEIGAQIAGTIIRTGGNS